MNEASHTVCAVVVTYNRKKLLIECLDALVNQTRPVQGIYIIDNASNDGTPELLMEKGYILQMPPDRLSEPWEMEFDLNSNCNNTTIKVHYVRLDSNTGGAGGFHEGVKRAYQRGYDWLWLMDDDAEPEKEALENLVKYYNNNSNIIALANKKIDFNTGNILIQHRGYFNFENPLRNIVKPVEKQSYINKNQIEIDHASFVGILINKKAISKIGFPAKEFFIHYDDVECCIRLRKVGKIILIPEAVILHKEAASKETVEKTILGRKSTRIPYDKLWLKYYGKRNLVWLSKKYSTNKVIFYFGLLKLLFRSSLGIILYDDHKAKRLVFLWNSIMDGLRGIFDNEKPKRLLYS